MTKTYIFNADVTDHICFMDMIHVLENKCPHAFFTVDRVGELLMSLGHPITIVYPNNQQLIIHFDKPFTNESTGGVTDPPDLYVRTEVTKYEKVRVFSDEAT